MCYALPVTLLSLQVGYILYTDIIRFSCEEVETVRNRVPFKGTGLREQAAPDQTRLGSPSHVRGE